MAPDPRALAINFGAEGASSDASSEPGPLPRQRGTEQLRVGAEADPFDTAITSTARRPRAG